MSVTAELVAKAAAGVGQIAVALQQLGHALQLLVMELAAFLVVFTAAVDQEMRRRQLICSRRPDLEPKNWTI